MAEAEAEAAVAIPIATLRPGDYVLWPEYPRCPVAIRWMGGEFPECQSASFRGASKNGRCNCLQTSGRWAALDGQDPSRPCLSTFRAGADEHPRRGGQNGRTLAWPVAAILPGL